MEAMDMYTILELASLEEQASLIAASDSTIQTHQNNAFSTITLYTQLVEAACDIFLQIESGQFMGRHGNSVEQYLRNAKRLNEKLHALLSGEFTLAVTESDKNALVHASHEEIDRMSKRFVTLFDAIDVLLTASLDLLHARPFSSSAIRESKL